MRDRFVSAHLNNDFVRRSKQSAFGFMAINIFYLFYLGGNVTNRKQVLLVVILMNLISIFRIILSISYQKKKRWANLKFSSRSTYGLAIANGFSWACMTYLIMHGTKEDISGIILTFIITIAFSGNSLATLGYHRSLLFIYNFSIDLPLVFSPWIVEENLIGFNFKVFSIIAIVHFIYIWRQSSQVVNDTTIKLDSIYHLRKTLNALEVNKRKLQEETLKNIHGSRLSILGEMAASIAHEINNPLTIIKGNVVILEKIFSGEEELSRVKKILMATTRIEKIVRNMKLMTSKKDLDVFQKVDIENIFQMTFDLVLERFKFSNIIFQIDEIPSCSIYCNSIQISQILVNLFNNAIDALEEIQDEEKFIAVKFSKEIYQLKIIIQNSGPKISEEVYSKLFNPFFTTKPIGKGTGLGLSISKQLAVSHGGDLYLDSSASMTSFVLNLPLK